MFACALKPKSLVLCRRVGCDIESKALDRSKKAPVTMFFLLRSYLIFSVQYKRASVVDTFFLYPNCVVASNLFFSK